MTKFLFSFALVLTMMAGAQAGTSAPSAPDSDLRCKAFAGGGDNYGIVAITDSFNSALDACQEMGYNNCTVSCANMNFRSCKGYARVGRDMEVIAIADTVAGVEAACREQGKNCTVTCGRHSGSSQGGGNAGGPGDR